MPAFHPPLASTTPVPVPDNAPPGAFAQLTFSAVFDPQEDTSGRWEIWTDLPGIRPDGTVHSQPGEWHAATFLPLDALPPDEHGEANGDGPITSPSAVTIAPLDASLPASTPAPEPSILSLTLAVPATAGVSYSYTFRHLTTDGELHWLGGLGGNGVVKLYKGASGAGEGGIKVGGWPIEVDDGDLAWSGVGIELLESNGASIPRIRPIPSAIGISPTLVLLSATPTTHLSGFSRISSNPHPLLAKTPALNLALVAPSGTPLTLSSGSTLPTADPGSTPTYGFAKDSPLREVFRSAYAAANPDHTRFILGELAESSGDEVDLAAAFFLPGQGEAGIDSAYLAVYSPPYTKRVTDVAVLLPASVGGLAPLAVLSEGTSTPAFIPAPHSQGTPRKIDLHLPAGGSAALLRLIKFIELSATGEATDSADAVWICAPDAVGYEHGEAQVETVAVPSPMGKVAASESIVLPQKVLPKDVELVEEEYEHQVPGGFVTPQPQTQPDVHKGYDSISEPVHDESEFGNDTDGGTWWLFRVISTWFVDFWNMLLSPFRKTTNTITVGGEGEDTGGDQEEVQVDDRTALLDSDLSRATSSTAFSPAVSPSRRPDIKPVAFSTSEPEQEAEKEEQSEPLRTVEIRSYTQLTFNHPSPWRFFLPPSSSAAVAVQEKLKLRAKAKGAQGWEKVLVDVKDGEGVCVEVVASGMEGEEGETWDVEIERV